MTLVWIGVYFVMVWVALKVMTPELSGPWAFLLRAFLPNWKFFQRPGHIPVLVARHGTRQGQEAIQWSAWCRLYPRASRRWSHCLHNPAVNELLARQNLVDHFWSDVYALDPQANPADLLTYRMITRWVMTAFADTGCACVQFQLHMVRRNRHGEEDDELMLISAVETC